MTGPQKILFVDHASALGGAEGILLDMLHGLDRSRWSPHLACVQGHLTEEALRLGIPVHQVSMPRLRRSGGMIGDWIGGARRLASLARGENIPIIYSNTVRAMMYAVLAARLARRKLVWHMHDFWLSESRPSNPAQDQRLKRVLTSQSDRVIAISQSVANHLPAQNKIHVIHNGIDLTAYSPGLGRKEFRADFGIQEETPVIGMVGRLRPWKGQPRFMRLAAEVKRHRPETRFLIVGGSPFQVEDDYPHYLKELQSDLGLSDQLIMTGHVEDVRPALAAMDIFVHPGDPEPFGLVNLEAMAMELPVAAFAQGALPEIVEDGLTGRLVPPLDEDQLAVSLIDLISDLDLCKEMGRKGRKRVDEEFQASRMVGQVDELLRGLP